jgi:hypothetical protein
MYITIIHKTKCSDIIEMYKTLLDDNEINWQLNPRIGLCKVCHLNSSITLISIYAKKEQKILWGKKGHQLCVIAWNYTN